MAAAMGGGGVCNRRAVQQCANREGHECHVYGLHSVRFADWPTHRAAIL